MYASLHYRVRKNDQHATKALPLLPPPPLRKPFTSNLTSPATPRPTTAYLDHAREYHECSISNLAQAIQNGVGAKKRRDADYRANNIPDQPCIFDNADPTRTNYTEELADKWPVGGVHSRALHALAIATRVHLQLDAATTSLKIVEAPVDKAPWRTEQDGSDPALRSSARTRALAGIARLESGILLLEPSEFDKTLAIASGNSIVVVAAMISDPFENLAADSVKRITGNIGRTGIPMLVALFEPKIRPLGNHHNFVENVAYDGK